jgi:hypothetical protein
MTLIVEPFMPVPETVVPPGQIVALMVGAVEGEITVLLEEAKLTHFPLSVCVAVKTSDAAKVETLAVHTPPLTVAVPI